jgi:hypothetical protein
VGLSETEELELLQLQKQKATSAGPSMMQRGWDALKRPEQMSRQGLGQLAAMVPEGKITGNLPMDLLRGSPRIAANTLAEAAPGFISRGAIMGSGALAGLKGLSFLPKVRAAAGELAGQFESAAGSPKGTLARGFESAKNFFGPGRKSASPLYESARPFTVHPELQDVFENKQMIEKSMELAKKGQLSPFEAFNARRGIDKLMGKSGYSEDMLHQMRQMFDEIVKTDPKLAAGDVQYAGGMKNEALRGFLPKNKYGTTSAFKTGIMAGVPGAAAVLSPIVQGAVATALGAGVRARPTIAAIIAKLLEKKQGPDANSNP